jgi:hypothetical protein
MKATIRGKVYDTENSFLVHGVYETVEKDYREENVYMNFDGEFFIESARICNFEDRSCRRLETKLKPISKNRALKRLKTMGFASANIESIDRLVCV